jgi:small subunit ribosomal protein S7e
LTSKAKKELKAELKKIQIVGANEYSIQKTVGGQVNKILLIYVSYPSFQITLQHMQSIIQAVESKRGVATFITAKRTILSKWLKVHKSQVRPRNRTLTSVHDDILEDLLAPATISGRRLRYVPGKKVFYKM